jgi:hypothetical protein
LELRLESSADERARSAYLHWDKVRNLDPPPGLTPELWWLKIKLARGDEWRALPLRDRNGIALGSSRRSVISTYMSNERRPNSVTSSNCRGA